jgi:ketosteroid isomerase-like protein
MTLTQPPRTAGPREVFARLMEAVLDLEMDAQADLYAEDGILEWPFAPPGMPRRVEGREAIRRLLVPLSEQAKLAGRRPVEYRALVIHETTDPEVIVAEFDLQGKSANGEQYQLSYIQVLRVRDGQIVSFRDYWSPRALTALLDQV